MDIKTFPNGNTYISHASLCFGDYGGAGSVGAANIRALREDFPESIEEFHMNTWDRGDELIGHEWQPIAPTADLVVTFGAYSSQQAWIKDSEQAREIIEGLDNYPLISDDVCGGVEIEWENEAWDSWLRSDLLRTLDDETFIRSNRTLRELADDVSPDDLFQAYRDAMDETNTYPEPEMSGVYVDIDRIKDAFAANVRALVE